MTTQDFGFNHLMTTRRGDQSGEPDLWTVRVFYDSKVYYYDVNVNDKDEFEVWADETFGEVEFSDTYKIEWR